MAEDKRNPLKAGLEVDELAGRSGGGFGTRPYPQSKVALRNAGKRAAAEAELNSPEALARREARKERFQPKDPAKRFRKGGMVTNDRSPKPGHVGPGTTGSNRDYAK